jgi:hypothetical protein
MNQFLPDEAQSEAREKGPSLGDREYTWMCRSNLGKYRIFESTLEHSFRQIDHD